jgi:ABC-type transporter Mla MlaB component
VSHGEVHATVVVVRGGAVIATWPLSRAGRIDLGIVDELGRLHLAARRLGCSILLREPGRELQELLELAGLDQVLSVSDSV